MPCGKLAAAVFAKAAVTLQPASLEENVKGVVAKVTLGEADAGIVYVTDVKAAGDKAQGVDIDIAGDPALEAAYPMAVTAKAANAAAASAWLELVRSEEGQAALQKFGFRTMATRRGRRPPVLALVVGGIGASFFVLPLAGLAWRARGPPPRGPDQPGSDDGVAVVSSAVWATAISVVLGVPLAWVLAR